MILTFANVVRKRNLDIYKGLQKFVVPIFWKSKWKLSTFVNKNSGRWLEIRGKEEQVYITVEA